MVLGLVLALPWLAVPQGIAWAVPLWLLSLALYAAFLRVYGRGHAIEGFVVVFVLCMVVVPIIRMFAGHGR